MKGESGEQDIIMSYISFIRHLISPELLKSQGCDGKDTFKGCVTMKCPEELWNINWRVEGVLGGQDFDGRTEWRMT
jgi:hypothetical protein